MAGAGGVGGWHVQVTNLRQVYDALGEMDKKAQRRVTREITTAGKRVVGHAKDLVGDEPLSGWGAWNFSRDGRDLGFRPADVVSGFTLRRNNYRRRGVSAGIGWDVWQRNAGGAIFEVIGDKSRVGGTPFDWQGEGFVDRITARNPRKQPRTLIQAYYRVMTKEFRDALRDQIIREAREAGLR